MLFSWVAVWYSETWCLLCVCLSLSLSPAVNGSVVLESVQYPGQHVGVLPDGTVKDPAKTGVGQHAQFIPTVHTHVCPHSHTPTHSPLTHLPPSTLTTYICIHSFSPTGTHTRFTSVMLGICGSSLSNVVVMQWNSNADVNIGESSHWSKITILSIGSLSFGLSFAIGCNHTPM